MKATEIQETVVNFMLEPYEKIFGLQHPSNALLRRYMLSLSTDEFDRLMGDAEKGEWTIPFYSPNLTANEATKKNFLAMADLIGLKLFDHVIIVDDLTGEEKKTPLEYLTLLLPVRRQIQHLVKKLSVPEDPNTVDHLTGQVTGDSKSSSMSLPELLALEARGINKGLLELIKARGGDETALRELNRLVDTTGGFSVGRLEELESKPKIVETIAAFLFAMGYDNNFRE